MTIASLPHILFLLAAVAFMAGSMWVLSKLPRRWQNVMFVIAVLVCSGLLFFQNAMGLKLDREPNWRGLAMSWLQVCSFNFILVWLMLIPRCELARQYSVFFSMFAASTTLFALLPEWANRPWYHISIVTCLTHHLFAIVVPLWMVATRRLKPRKEYIWKVTACVFVYMTAVAIIVTILMKQGVITNPKPAYSFIYNTTGVPVFDWLWKLIPVPYFYLYPLGPVMVGFFYLLAWLFRNYEVKPYWIGRKEVYPDGNENHM